MKKLIPWIAAFLMMCAAVHGDSSVDWSAYPVLIKRIDGRLISTRTGAVFSPVGFNYIRLDAKAWHQTFAPRAYNDGTNTVQGYDGPAATAMFKKLAAAKFNTVRVFINQSVKDPASVVAGSAATVGLDPAYMDNVTDFLRRARAEDIFVIPALGFFPATDYYNALCKKPGPANVTGGNLYYFDPQRIVAKKRYIKDFFDAILIRDPEAIRAVLALDLGNELCYPVDAKPFNLSTGSVTGPNGVTYDLATQKSKMADEVAIFWINETDKYVKELIPGMLTDVNVFTCKAVSRSVNDFTVLNIDWKDRYPWRPRATVQSTADIVDLHIYPGATGDIDQDLISVEWGSLKPEADAAGKVLLVGEFGVNYAKFGKGAFDTAKLQAPAFARYFNQKGFAGWLMWTYDSFEQSKHYPAAQENFTIFNLLADEIPGK